MRSEGAAPQWKPSAELYHYRIVLGIVRRLYGPTSAASFGPGALYLVRDEMIATGWSRRYIAQQVGRVRRVLKWAASRELIPTAVAHGLDVVEGLRRGERSVVNPEPIRPVPDPFDFQPCSPP